MGFRNTSGTFSFTTSCGLPLKRCRRTKRRPKQRRRLRQLSTRFRHWRRRDPFRTPLLPSASQEAIPLTLVQVVRRMSENADGFRDRPKRLLAGNAKNGAVHETPTCAARSDKLIQKRWQRTCPDCGRPGTMVLEEPEHDSSGEHSRWKAATGCWETEAGKLIHRCRGRPHA